MWLSLPCMIFAADPPAGGISPLAWTIIGALAAVCVTVVPALWHRGNKERDRADQVRDELYKDLRECNKKRVESEDEMLDLMKLLRLMMEQPKSKGGK